MATAASEVAAALGYGLDAWRCLTAQAWQSGTPQGNWCLPEVFSPMSRGYEVVWREDTGPQKGKDFDGYYLLFALEELGCLDAFARTRRLPELPPAPDLDGGGQVDVRQVETAA
ncbi:MAG: hypothetical protein GXY83_14260 [Rhodopirellula sp.]|nr:hypothetical protein [Rhodopirellula sp.]